MIRTAFIYNPATVKPVGESVIDTDSAFDNARYPLAQVFTPRKAAHRPFITIANHFKSKGSCPAEPDDPNADTGQGCWNALRVEQSTALAGFAASLAASARTDRVFLIGDFNAYTTRTRSRRLAAAGYTDQGGKTGKYSYSYGGESGSLDHILASAAAEKLVTGADIWNINAGEAIALEYSRYNYNATNFYDASPYRSSDHDPVVVGFALKVKPARTHTALTLSQNRVPSGTAVSATATVRGCGNRHGGLPLRPADDQRSPGRRGSHRRAAGEPVGGAPQRARLLHGHGRRPAKRVGDGVADRYPGKGGVSPDDDRCQDRSGARGG